VIPLDLVNVFGERQAAESLFEVPDGL